MSDRDREHHDVGGDPSTARLPHGGALPAADYTFDDEMPRLSPEDQRTVDALRPGTALLIVLRGPNTGARFLLDADEVSSGRHPHSDIFLDDVTVSRRHALFVKDERGGKVFVDSTRVGGATVVAAYSPRVRPGTPVSFPVRWDDLEEVTQRRVVLPSRGQLAALSWPRHFFPRASLSRSVCMLRSA